MRIRTALLAAALCIAAPAALFPQTVSQVVNSVVATTCSAQFVRAIAASGAATCASIANADLVALAGQYPGVTTSTAANAGNIGQLVTNSVAVGAGATLTSGQAADITSVSLTAGVWDLTCFGGLNPGATTSVTYTEFSMGSTSATRNTGPGSVAMLSTAAQVPVGDSIFVVGPARALVTSPGPQTFYCVSFVNFTSTAPKNFGFLRATRVY